VNPAESAPVFLHAAPRRHGKDSGSPTTVSRPQWNEAEGSKKLTTQSAKASRRAGSSKRAKVKGKSTKSSNKLPPVFEEWPSQKTPASVNAAAAAVSKMYPQLDLTMQHGGDDMTMFGPEAFWSDEVFCLGEPVFN
jgi:hypothetical protein